MEISLHRLWYIREKESHSGSKSSLKDQPQPIEVGYMNVIPKCLDSSLKYPVYENLPETYKAINEYLAEHPLEGKFVRWTFWCARSIHMYHTHDNRGSLFVFFGW